MNPRSGSRWDRMIARDAALRRIAGWTTALAVGGVAGTAAVAVATANADVLNATAAGTRSSTDPGAQDQSSDDGFQWPSIQLPQIHVPDFGPPHVRSAGS